MNQHRLKVRQVPPALPTPSAPHEPAIVAEARRLQSLGYTPVPCRGKHVPPGDTPDRVYSPEECKGWERVRVRTGVAVNGGPVVVRVDIDKHHDYQDPAARLAEIRAALPTADAARLVVLPSTNGAGLDVVFLSSKAYATQTIYGPDGAPAGELICQGGVQLAPAPPEGVTIPAFGKETRERLLGALHFAPHAGPHLAPGHSDRKADIREGLGLTAGWERERATIPDWRAFLQCPDPRCSPAQCKVAADLLAAATRSSDRSQWLATFVQHLMLRGRELGRDAAEIYRRVMALAVSTDALGKGGERGYNIVKDTAALIARIARGALKADGNAFLQPHWCKARPAGCAPKRGARLLHQTPAAKRPAHRPRGARDKGVAALVRELARRAEDKPGRLHYYSADLGEAIGVKMRTTQGYLATLEQEGMVVRGQEGGRGGPGWLELLPAFWGANKYLRASHQRPKSTPQTPAPGLHIESLPEAPGREETRSTLQCIEITKDLSGPSLPCPALASEASTSAAPSADEQSEAATEAGAPAGAQPSSGDLVAEPTFELPTLAVVCARVLVAYPRRRLTTLVQLVCDNAPHLDVAAVRATYGQARMLDAAIAESSTGVPADELDFSLQPSAAPAPAASAPQDIDISRISGSATEQRMAAVYRAQGEQVRIIPRDEQQRDKRGDLERTLSDGRVIFTEVKGEREYPGRCAAIEFETVPLNAVAYGGPSGPAESRADTFTYVNSTTGAWWELETAMVRVLVPTWQQLYRVVDGKVNERETPYGHARYFARCVLVPQAVLPQLAIASGIASAPDPLVEAVRVAYDAVASVERVNEGTGEIKRQTVTLQRIVTAMVSAGYDFTTDGDIEDVLSEVEAALDGEREARRRDALLAPSPI